jgi:hypothetical protein
LQSSSLSYLFLIWLFSTTQLLNAQNNSDTVYRFLDISPDARISGLGGTQTALIDGDFSMFVLNPAYLFPNHSGYISATYMNHIGDVNYGSFSGAYNLKNYGTIGVSFRVLNYGELQRYDEFGEDLGDFRANDLAFTTGFGAELAPNWYYGISFSLIHSAYGYFSSTALTGSAGILFRDPERRTTAGVSVTNAGTQLSTFNGQKESPPFDISAGVSHELEYLPLRLSVTARQLHNWNMENNLDSSRPGASDQFFRHIIAGGELILSSNLHLRFGYNHNLHQQTKTGKRIDGAGLSMGLGIKIRDFQIDFARNSYSDLGNLIQLGIKTRVF